MSSKPSRTSKESYNGINVRRMPRSEFDDSMMRGLTRHDNRLDHDLKTVDRAKDVIMKSLESEKHMFLRGGVRTNKKYTATLKNPGDSRQKKEVTSPTSKYQPDTRKGRPTTNGTISQLSDPGNDAVDKVGGSRDILTETREVIERQKRGDALVDDYFSRKAEKDDTTTPTTTVAYVSDRRASDSSITPTIKIDDCRTPDDDEKAAQAGGQPFVFYDDLSSYGRRPDFWNYLSQPKNPSRNLLKREQLEREFSSTALGSRATTPSARSARGSRMPPTTSSLSPSPTSTYRAKSATGIKKSLSEGKINKGKGK